MFGRKYDDQVRLPANVQTVPKAQTEALERRQALAMQRMGDMSLLARPVSRPPHLAK